jgi:hypothetical protein
MLRVVDLIPGFDRCEPELSPGTGARGKWTLQLFLGSCAFDADLSPAIVGKVKPGGPLTSCLRIVVYNRTRGVRRTAFPIPCGPLAA